MRVHTWARWAGLAAAGALTLAACSNGGDENGETPDHLTISELMGAPNYESEDYQAKQQEVEEAVAQCMIDEGWEYIPVQYPDDWFSGEYSDEDEVERIKREGLGIAYWTLNPNGGDIIVDPTDEWVDPNQDYVNNLSPDEQTAYYETLYGKMTIDPAATDDGFGVEASSEAIDSKIIDPGGEPQDTGCQGKAQAEVYGEDPTQSPGFWEAVQQYYEELSELQAADPRIVDLNTEWAACMKDKGFEYQDTTEYWDKVYTEFQERQTEILGDDFYKDPMEGWTQQQIDDFWATATQEQIDALYKQPELTADQRSQLEEQLADEVKIALAEHDCSKDYNTKAAEIYAQIEEDYARDHEEELKQLAASLASE